MPSRVDQGSPWNAIRSTLSTGLVAAKDDGREMISTLRARSSLPLSLGSLPSLNILSNRFVGFLLHPYPQIGENTKEESEVSRNAEEIPLQAIRRRAGGLFWLRGLFSLCYLSSPPPLSVRFHREGKE